MQNFKEKEFKREFLKYLSKLSNNGQLEVIQAKAQKTPYYSAKLFFTVYSPLSSLKESYENCPIQQKIGRPL